MRNRVLAVVVAMLSVGVLQLGAIFVADAMSHNEDYELLARTIMDYVGQDYLAVLPTLAAAAAGAVLAGVMVALMKLDQSRPVSLPGQSIDMPRARDRDGKLRRAPGMIEERPIHEAAESRIDQIMKL